MVRPLRMRSKAHGGQQRSFGDADTQNGEHVLRRLHDPINNHLESDVSIEKTLFDVLEACSVWQILVLPTQP